jgi:hypothetical protein
MSEERLIQQGMIVERKQQLMDAMVKGKKELQALLNCAMLAKGKDLEHIDIAALNTHLDALSEHQATTIRLIREIAELSE